MSSLPAAGQAGGIRVGVQAEYLWFLSHWRHDLGAGPGLTGFAGVRHGIIETRLGTAVSFHDEPVLSVGTSNQRPQSVTKRIWRYFGEVRLGPTGPPSAPLPSLAIRAGRLHAPMLGTPWVWHFELAAAATIPVGPRPEVFLAGGIVRFPDEGLPRPNTAHTVRLGVSLQTRISRR